MREFCPHSIPFHSTPFAVVVFWFFFCGGGENHPPSSSPHPPLLINVFRPTFFYRAPSPSKYTSFPVRFTSCRALAARLRRRGGGMRTPSQRCKLAVHLKELPILLPSFLIFFAQNSSSSCGREKKFNRSFPSATHRGVTVTVRRPKTDDTSISAYPRH